MKKLTMDALGRLSPAAFAQAKKNSLVIVLDNVRSGHNVGAAFRIADAFLIEKIYLCGITPQPPHGEIHKTALGAEAHVAWTYVPTTQVALQQLKQVGYTVVGVEQTDSSVDLDKFSPATQQKYALVFGHEVFGVSDPALEVCDLSIDIPQQGVKHSLNVSVTIGIVVWKFTQMT